MVCYYQQEFNTIKNEGEFDVLSAVHTGAKARITFQAADVRKPLVAVSSLVDAIFDQRSFVLPGNAPEVDMIRQLVAQIKGRIPMYREKGIYKMRNWGVPKSGFTRLGA